MTQFPKIFFERSSSLTTDIFIRIATEAPFTVNRDHVHFIMNLKYIKNNRMGYRKRVACILRSLRQRGLLEAFIGAYSAALLTR